jgi:phenylalanyl-tRNA synthetase alpha chain
MSLSAKIEEIRSEFIKELKSATHSKDLENLKVRFLGKKGPIQQLMMELKNCTPDERPLFGKLINDLKEDLTSHVDNTLARILEQEKSARFDQEKIDITLPGKTPSLGKTHPITQMLNKAVSILVNMGFSVQYGPDIDSDYYNFGALNFPPDHPARDMQDTFYITADLLLRTHTSNVQVRTMESSKPPIRVIAPGRCFRNETISSRSHVFFHQIEGFYVDKNVTFTDLMNTMDQFWKAIFGQDVKTRFRPSYFPFVEPGLEVDVECTSCKGQGCRLCKQSGWLEVAGAGMIHPEVLKAGGIDPEEYSGYAWGMGIERIAMLQYGIKDIRLFTENDTRFLEQFP